MKRLLKSSVGLVLADFVGPRWGVATLFDPDGKVARHRTFNNALRGLGRIDGFYAALQDLGLPAPEARTLGEEAWEECSRPTEWPGVSILVGVLILCLLALVGAVTVFWILFTRVL